MNIGLFEIEIEGVRFKSVEVEGGLKNRIVKSVNEIEYGYIFPITVSNETIEILIPSGKATETVKLKTSTGKVLHRVVQLAQIIEQVTVTNGYLEVPRDVYKAVFGKNAYESFSTFVGYSDGGTVYIDSNSKMFMVGDPTKHTSRPHIELPVLSSYLYLIDDKPMEIEGVFTDIKSIPLEGTPYFINYNLNNVVHIEERIKASRLYYGKFLEHININESLISEYVQNKIKKESPELIKGIEVMEAEELIESFKDIDPNVIKIARAISKCKNINETEMKDYIYRYMKYYERKG